MPLAFLLIVIIMAGIEAQTYFMEETAGKFLNRINRDREPWGTAWDRQEKLRAAAEKLDEEAAQSSKLRQKIEKVDSFRELLNLLPDGRGINVSPGKFVELYKDLPQPLRSRLIDPALLTDHYLSGDWQRTSLWKSDDGATVYLVDSRNQVISNVKVSNSLIRAASIFGKTSPGRLIDNLRYTAYDFAPQEFFEAVSGLSEADRTRLFGVPDLFLELPQTVTRIGIAYPDESDDFAIVAFEAVGDQGVELITYPVESTSIRSILNILTGVETDSLKTSVQPDSLTLQEDSVSVEDTLQ